MTSSSTPARAAAPIIVALCSIAIAACASRPPPHTRWERINATPEQVAYDHRQCELEVEQGAISQSFENPAVAEPQAMEDLRERRWRRQAFFRCMVDKGYRRVDAN